jgi:hypothetical protein
MSLSNGQKSCTDSSRVKFFRGYPQADGPGLAFLVSIRDAPRIPEVLPIRPIYVTMLKRQKEEEKPIYPDTEPVLK